MHSPQKASPRGKHSVPKKEFENVLLEAIDEALATLGDSAKQSIYFHLENKFKVAKKDIPSHVKDFEDGLEKIFGIGAKFIEILIMKNLHEKIGHNLKWDETKELVFADYVSAARQSFLQIKRN
jgi:adenylyl- and sulfurtransferase ThiI